MNNKIKHSTAGASHYDNSAKNYDRFNEENSKALNDLVEKTLSKYGIKTVLDITCGTGSQVFWLHNAGYEIIGLDINSKMLDIAKSKAADKKFNLDFFQGDMRTIQIGKFDAVISMFNAVGHLTKSDFELAIRNISQNLKCDGLYIFDINNLNFLLSGDNITSLTIDWVREDSGGKIRDIQYSTISKDGILASYTTSYIQKSINDVAMKKSDQTLQIYSLKELSDMLLRNGFEVLEYSDIDGSKFVDDKTERIFMVAKKVSC